MNIEIVTKRDKIINFYGRIFFFTSFPLNLGGCVFVELGGKFVATPFSTHQTTPLSTHQTKENQKLQLLFWGIFYHYFSIVQVFLPTKHITRDPTNFTIYFLQLIKMTIYNC